MTAFLAALHGPEPESLARALGDYNAADAIREGPLTVAAAPWSEPAATWRCVLDGEIDNLEQIARAAGIDPNLPPEPLLSSAHERLGDDALLALLRGSFALLIWEPGGARAIAARDQLGQRSVVWSRIGGAATVACEAAELVALRAVAAEPDEVGLAHWLALEGIPEDRTLIRGISRLPPGHALVLSAEGARIWRYWRPEPGEVRRICRNDAVALLRAKLAASVASQARPSTAVLLSGGLDSTTVAALARVAPDPVDRAYSALFPGHAGADESELIELTAKALELSVVAIAVSGGSVVAGALPYLERWLVPPATPNMFFWLPLLSRAAADGTRRMLDGEGGDELFGLAPALLADRIRRGDLVGALRLTSRIPGLPGRLPGRTIGRLLYHHGVKGALPHGPARFRRRFDRRRAVGPDWLGARLTRLLRETSPPGEWKQAGAPRWWAQLLSTVSQGPGSTLAYDDIRRRDGLVGITSRHPLADLDLLELVLSLPPELAYDSRHTRPLLRSAVSGLIPDRVRLRTSKSHFGGPFHSALAGPDLAIARDLLGPEALSGAYIDLGRARATLLTSPPPEADSQRWTLTLWRLLTAELWMRTLADRGFPAGLAERCPAPELAALRVLA